MSRWSQLVVCVCLFGAGLVCGHLWTKDVQCQAELRTPQCLRAGTEDLCATTRAKGSGVSAQDKTGWLASHRWRSAQRRAQRIQPRPTKAKPKVRKMPVKRTGPSSFRKLDLFASVLSYIENDYVDPPDGAALIRGAVQGMMKLLDPYSVFIPAKQYQEMRAETSGEYGGPGLEISRRGRLIVVISPIPGSPAAKAGIRAGDVILKAAGKKLRGMNLLQARRLLRGRPGTKLDLTITRRGWRKPGHITLIRRQIRVRSIVVRTLEPGYHSIRIKSFQDRTERQIKAALELLKKSGPLKGLILDMRGNPGGLFDQAVRVVDLFVKRGLIVVTRGRKLRKAEKEQAHTKHTMSKLPLVVLIDRGSASAAEIVAGALQEHRRALTVGQRSFGKGSVQTIIDLAGGAGLKLTVARYYTPLDRQIQGKGLNPDVVVATQPGRRGDYQQQRALYFLKHPRVFKRYLGHGLPASLQKRFP